MSTSLASLYGSLCGPLYFATIMSTAFYGITCMQTFFYYVHYQNDSLRVKIPVLILWALNTINEALSVAGVYKYTIAGLADPLSFETDQPEMILQYFMTVLVAVPTQGFFVYRIYVFSGKKIIALLLVWVALALTELVFGIVYIGIALYSATDGVHVVALSILNSGLLKTIGTSSLVVAAVVDVLIAICMTFMLLRERAATSFASTAHMLQRLTIFAVNTGIWTATFALMTTVLLQLFPTRTLYAVFAIPLCSVYCNTLLANLNARSYVRDEAMKYDVDMGSAASSGLPAFNNTKTARRGDTN